MKPLEVVSIQKGCVYDGPGLRTTVFLKGCTLKCPWCCNPECISFERQQFVDDERCFLNKGIESSLCSKCTRKGGANAIEFCPIGIVEPTSNSYSTGELETELLRNIEYDDGGVTFSGGEPLLYASALKPLLYSLQNHDVNIFFETTLTTPFHNLEVVVDYTDGFIIDLKLQTELLSVVGKEYVDHILESLNYLRAMGKIIIYRMVFIDSLCNNKRDVLYNLQCIGVNSLEVLRCHGLAANKYKKLGMPFVDYTADFSKMDAFTIFLNENGINTTSLSI